MDPSCVLCGRPCTLRHLLNACSSALHQGRYTWRHNSVLTIIQKRLIAFWTADATQKAINTRTTGQRYITFVPAGHSGALTSRSSSRRPLVNQNILLQASDWDFRFDLGSEPLQFPTEVAATTLRPDVVIYSRTKKIVIMLELTVPLEDRSHLAHDRKTSKYAPPCPHLWGAWLHNPCLCFGSRLSRFLPTHVPHLFWGAWFTQIVSTPDKNRVCTCGTALLLPPVPSERHRPLEWPWVSLGMNPGFTCKLHLTLSSSSITNSQAWLFPIFTWRHFQRLQRYVFA